MLPISEHPVNRAIVDFLSRRMEHENGGIRPPRILSYLPPEDSGFGIHPDAVQHFWRVLPSLLPIDCRLEVLGFPALVHPSRGVVFGVAFGFNYIAVRLPEILSNSYCAGERSAAVFPDWQQREFRGLPNDWTMLRWGIRDPERCLAAYRHAGGLRVKTLPITAGWWIWSTLSFRVTVDADECHMDFALEEVGREIVSAVEQRASKIDGVTVIIHSWRNSLAVEVFQDRLKELLASRVFIPVKFEWRAGE